MGDKLFLLFRKVIFKLNKLVQKLVALILNDPEKIRVQKQNVNFALEDVELDLTNQECADWIKNRLLSGEPTMIARFGSVELANLLEYNYHYVHKQKKSFLEKLYSYAHNNRSLVYDWNERQALKYNAGFFPNDKESITRFYNLMIESMKELDLLGSWVKGENLLRHNFPYAKICRLGDLEPYFQPIPWSIALEGKKVLVIHPFEDSIKSQYLEHRTKLFKNPQVLPEFHLSTVKAVQSIGGVSNRFKTWFEALEFMKQQIDSIDFDIAIIGCGAYGFPLAAHVKKNGKQAIHLGGATQLLFGIRGKRWDEDPRYSNFINNFWKRPLEDERPKMASIVEEGCYW